MSDENDSWFKNAFGIDLGKAVGKIKDEVSAAASSVSQVAGKVQGAAEQSPASGGAGSFPLGGSVGRGAKNAAGDVRAVQAALGIPADGDCGPQTVAAIEAYQRKLGHAKPDGRVDAGGATERALAGGGAKPSVPNQLPSSGQATGKRQHKPFSPSALLDTVSFNDEANEGSQLVEQLQDVGGRIVDGALEMVPDAIPVADMASAGGDDGSVQRTVKRLVAKIKSGGDFEFDMAVLERKEMSFLLDVMDGLKRAGKLEALSDRAAPGNRVGVAILTIRPDFDEPWRQLVAGLNAADRKAVLQRTPKDVQVAGGLGPAPAPPKGETGGGVSGGSISIGPEGVTVSATLGFESKAFGSLGKTDFNVTLRPDGTLGEFAVDMTLVRKRLEGLAMFDSVLDLEATLGLNAATELSRRDAQTIFEGVQAGVKGEVVVRFKKIPPLRKVRFKMSTGAGSGGFNLGGAIEIPLPGP